MLKKLQKRFKNEKGFTLVELLAVIAILAIILAIAIPSVGNLISKSQGDADEANEKLFENAARLADLAGDMSGTSIDLDVLLQKGYLEEIPNKPGTDSPYSGVVEKKANDVEGSNGYIYEFNGGGKVEGTP